MSETQPIELEWLDGLLTRVEELDVRVRDLERAAERTVDLIREMQESKQHQLREVRGHQHQWVDVTRLDQSGVFEECECGARRLTRGDRVDMFRPS